MKKATVGFFVLVLALVVSACAPRQAISQVPERYLIVPGKSVGQLSLEMPIEGFIAKFGQPNFANFARPQSGLPFEPVRVYGWTANEIAVFTRPNHNNRVFVILIFRGTESAPAAENLRFTTDEGLGLKSFRLNIVNVYGRVAYQMTRWGAEWLFFENGLVFGFATADKPDQASAVGVWSKAVWNLP